MVISHTNVFDFAPCPKGPVDTSPNPDKSSDTDVNKDTVTLGSRKAGWLTDALAVAQFAGSGLLYKEAGKEAQAHQDKVPALSDAPLVKLEDPFLIAPGWTTLPEKFDIFISHLLKNDENGTRALYIKEGQAYSDKAATQKTEIGPDDKIFLALYDSVLSPPDKTAPQLSEAVSMLSLIHISEPTRPY